MRRLFRAGPLGAAGLALLLLGPAVLHAQYNGGGTCGSCSSCGASASSCGTCPSTHGCPPKVYHYSEGPPRIKFKCACPKPLCDPCHLEHYGYFQTCWAPWPYPPDWGHCPVPPPSAMLPPPAVPPFTPRTPGYTAPERITDDPGPEITPTPKTRPKKVAPKKVDPELSPPRPLDKEPSVRLIQ